MGSKFGGDAKQTLVIQVKRGRNTVRFLFLSSAKKPLGHLIYELREAFFLAGFRCEASELIVASEASQVVAELFWWIATGAQKLCNFGQNSKS